MMDSMNDLAASRLFAGEGSGVMYHLSVDIAEERSLENRDALNRFFAKVERRAFRMAELATSSDDVALDIVQDAMLALARKYPHKNEADWGPLFHRILQSKIRDWYRRSSVRNRVLGWLHMDEEGNDPIQQVPDLQTQSPEQTAQSDETVLSTMQAIGELPLRQQQCFLLRAWEGYSVRDTADIMSCTEGSVKTHYSRALKNLRAKLDPGMSPGSEVEL